MIKIKYNNSESMNDVVFSRVSPNVVELNGITEQNTSGFKTYKTNGVTNLGDFSDYKTIYRILDNAIQYSNNKSVYTQKTEISVNWNDVDNYDGIRPASINITIVKDGEANEVTLNKENNWSVSYIDQIIDHIYTVAAPEVEGYTKTINGTNVSYVHDADLPLEPIEPTIEERVTDLEDAVIELSEIMMEV